MIYSADKYFAANIFGQNDTTTCSMTGAPELESHASSFIGSSQFIYTMPDYDCLVIEDTSTCTWCASPHYYLYKKTTGTLAGEIYSLFGSFYQERNETFSSTNSQVQQLYLKNDSDGKPSFMAYSLAGAGPYDAGGGWYSRTLVLLNISENRFFIKYNDGVVAMGKGGFDPETGTIIGGNFVVRTSSNDVTTTFCITQSTTGALTFSADGSACDDDTELRDYFQNFFTENSSFWSTEGSDTAGSYFGLTEDEINSELISMGADVNSTFYSSIPTVNDDTEFPSSVSK